MPSARIYVGDDEVLLDDSLRFVERAVAAGVDTPQKAVKTIASVGKTQVTPCACFALFLKRVKFR
jgi:hypothetical protein